jgi:hypothetical protein
MLAVVTGRNDHVSLVTRRGEEEERFAVPLDRRIGAKTAANGAAKLIVGRTVS